MIAEQLERLLKAGGGSDGMEAMGLPRALAEGLPWAEAAPLWRLLGAHASEAPLGEAMLAHALLAEAGMGDWPGLVVAAEGAGAVPHGRAAGGVALPEGDALALRAPLRVRSERANLAGEPRDALDLHPTALAAAAPAAASRRVRLGFALLRAAQMAGAAQSALDLAVDWANTRKQFGRSVGKFQAVQQSLAEMAGQGAALDAAVALAARAVDARGLLGAGFEIACAKVVAGEAAARVAAGAHQCLAAMGMTEEFALQRFTRRLWAWRDEGGTEREWAAELGREAIGQGAGFWAALTGRDIAA